MSIQPPGVDTTPIRNAYDEISSKVNDLNKQVRNYNFKTILKTALFVSVIPVVGIGIALISTGLAGISLTITSWSLKTISILMLDTFIGYMAGYQMGDMFFKAAKKTNLEVTSKLNKEFKEAYKNNNEVLNKSLFGYDNLWLRSIRQAPEFRSYGTNVENIQLDSYETVEKRYIDIQQAIIRWEEEQNRQSSGLLSFLPSFLRGKASA
ncbi:MAG: hypothetical protein KR126chlam5_00372 [Candidatus Anoxychlamydiales bacterium]|nr:hypothetical protein [Candidatus Anoxychlamydiales bacterium]NGX52079.1 hypothetical protein [Candidatus Anoxychlamydiales bacterium]